MRGDPGGISEPIEIAGNGPGHAPAAERQPERLAIDAQPWAGQRIAGAWHGGGNLADGRYAVGKALPKAHAERGDEPRLCRIAGRPGPPEGDDAGDPAGQATVGIERPLEIGELEVGVGVDEARQDDRVTKVGDRRLPWRPRRRVSTAHHAPAMLDPQPAILDCRPTDRHDPPGPEVERFGPAHDFAAADTRLG